MNSKALHVKLQLFLTLVHSSYGVKARHGDGGEPGRLGARLARIGGHSARRWGGGGGGAPGDDADGADERHGVGVHA
jgi:hypothetical protein